MMTTPTRLYTHTASPNDLHKLAELVHFNSFVHRHIDYRPPLDWIGSKPFLILEQHGEIVAALACPPDPPTVAWIRVFAASSQVSLERAWDHLWSHAKLQLYQEKHLLCTAAIPMQGWFKSLLKKEQFQLTQHVQMMAWKGAELPTIQSQAPVVIRPMLLEDLEAICEIDEIAFDSIWQYSSSYLELAFRQAVFATVAEWDGGRLAGYQISTASAMGGHLARLAVHPQLQGQGIGYTMLHDLLSQFKQRGAQIVTVNTQEDNQASLSIYQKAGFRPTGEEFPIYSLPYDKN